MKEIEEEDFYDVLGVDRDATPAEMKKAYRRRAKERHPDRNKASNAHDEFVKLQLAYETLYDPHKRAHYDRTGRAPEINELELDARQYIINAFLNLAREKEWRQGPYMQSIKKATEVTMVKAYEARNIHHDTLMRMASVLPIKRGERAQDDNIFVDAIAKERQSIERKLELIKHDLAMFEEVLKLLGMYDDRMPTLLGTGPLSGQPAPLPRTMRYTL